MSDSSNTEEQPQPDTTPGIFSWNEIATSDVAGSTEFYSKLFDWNFESCEEMPHYKMIMAGDRMVGGMVDKSEQCDGPPCWLAYVNVDDVEAALSKANSLGGETFKEVTEVPGKGSFAIVKDPQGGMIALWQCALG